MQAEHWLDALARVINFLIPESGASKKAILKLMIKGHPVSENQEIHLEFNCKKNTKIVGLRPGRGISLERLGVGGEEAGGPDLFPLKNYRDQ
jgi:hypothetical protein